MVKRTELSEVQREPSSAWLTPISERARESSITRVRSWRRHDIWTLREACNVTFGHIPIPFLRGLLVPLWPYLADADNFLDYAKRAVLAGNLKTRTRSRFGFWTTVYVDPAEFCQWAAGRPDLIGAERAEVLEHFFPSSARKTPDELRRRVLGSDFSTPQFDAALAAIDQFWLQKPARDDAKPPTVAEIKSWLTENTDISPTAAERVARVIRPGEA